jgi:hypothetical protein
MFEVTFVLYKWVPLSSHPPAHPCPYPIIHMLRAAFCSQREAWERVQRVRSHPGTSTLLGQEEGLDGTEAGGGGGRAGTPDAALAAEAEARANASAAATAAAAEARAAAKAGGGDAESGGSGAEAEGDGAEAGTGGRPHRAAGAPDDELAHLSEDQIRASEARGASAMDPSIFSRLDPMAKVRL